MSEEVNALEAKPWLGIFLKSVFENRRINFVWYLIHPNLRLYLARALNLPDEDTTALTKARLGRIPEWPRDHPDWPTLEHITVNFFHQAFGEEFDYTQSEIVPEFELFAPGIEEYKVAYDKNRAPGEPYYGLRVSMLHDPSIDDGYSPSWYVAGLKGHIYE